MDWETVPRRLRKNHAPWDRNKSGFFLDSSDEWSIHARAADVIISTDRETIDLANVFSIDWLEELGILTPTLEGLMNGYFRPHGYFAEDDDVWPVVNTIMSDSISRTRSIVCKYLACEHFSSGFKQNAVHRLAMLAGFERLLSSNIVHESGVLSQLPDVSRQVALWSAIWLMLGSGVDPAESLYPALQSDIRWIDAYVRYIDPAAKMVVAHRMKLQDTPEFKGAIRALEKDGVHYECNTVDTLIGEKGFEWYIEGEELGALPKTPEAFAEFAVSLQSEDSTWRPIVEECRSMVSNRQEQEGLIEESLADSFSSQFPERASWPSIDAAMADGYRPFRMKAADQPRHAEHLLADLWAEYFGELAIQLEVMRWHDRITEPPTEGSEPSVVLKRIERSLHTSICDLLKRIYGADLWWAEGVPEKPRKSCAEMHEDDKCKYSKESYLYLLQHFDIIKKNWRFFEAPIQSALKVKSKTDCESWFTKLNTIRNLNAHPLRGDLSKKDQDQLRSIDQQVSSLTARLEQVELENERNDDAESV